MASGMLPAPIVIKRAAPSTKHRVGKFVAALLILVAGAALVICAPKHSLHDHRGDADKHEHRNRGDAEKKHDRAIHTYFLLDRSGSMGSWKQAVKDGFKEYVTAQQAQVAGTMYLTVAQFDSEDPFDVLVEKVEIGAASTRLDQYAPRSMTPLYDAIDSTIEHAKKTSDNSDDVILVVFTDGQENASGKANQQSVLAKITELKKRGWTFVFLGANIDSYATGGGMGYSKGSTMNYAASAAGIDYGWGTVSKAMSHQRTIRSDSKFDTKARMAASNSYFDSVQAGGKPDKP